MTVTVITSPNCQPCRATKRHLDRIGVAFSVVDVSEDAEAGAYARELGHLATPVVIVEEAGGLRHWSGYRPRDLDALAS